MARSRRWTRHFSVQLFSSTELLSRGSTEVSTYGCCEVVPSGEANRKNFPSCLSKINLSVGVLDAYSWWLCRVHGSYPDITEFCHWLKQIISSSTFLLKRAVFYSAKQDVPYFFKQGNVTMRFWEQSQHHKHRKISQRFNRPTIIEVPFHFLHDWRSAAALVLSSYKELRVRWVLIKPASSMASVRCFYL